MPSLDFRIQKQEHSDWCWAAVAASVDRYFNPRSEWCQCKLASRMAKTDKLKVRSCGNCKSKKPLNQICNRPWYLQEALKLVGRLKGKPKPGALKFSQIKKVLDQDKPVCVMVLWGGGPAAHFVVITGCAEGPNGERYVDVQDPDIGGSTWRYEEFKKNYQYYRGAWNYTFLVKG